jgi:hypothetical protein
LLDIEKINLTSANSGQLLLTNDALESAKLRLDVFLIHLQAAIIIPLDNLL